LAVAPIAINTELSGQYLPSSTLENTTCSVIGEAELVVFLRTSVLDVQTAILEELKVLPICWR
jgi:hypothetical protein